MLERTAPPHAHTGRVHLADATGGGGGGSGDGGGDDAGDAASPAQHQIEIHWLFAFMLL